VDKQEHTNFKIWESVVSLQGIMPSSDTFDLILDQQQDKVRLLIHIGRSVSLGVEWRFLRGNFWSLDGEREGSLS